MSLNALKRYISSEKIIVLWKEEGREEEGREEEKEIKGITRVAILAQGSFLFFSTNFRISEIQ